MSGGAPAGVPPFLTAITLATGGWSARAIGAAVRLGIPELLERGPRDVEALAAAAGAVPDHLYRLLRALAREGVFEEGPLRTFGPTAVTRALLPGAPGSVRDTVLWVSSPWVSRLWEKLEDAVRGEASALTGLFGARDVYQYLAEHPEDAAVFHGAMEELARLGGDLVAAAFDFARFGAIVDVGGGTGEQLAAILRRCPASRGVLFDAPEVAERARANLARLGVADRCEVASGDLRESVPRGGDAYVLKNILHDLNDERAAALLARCREAARPGGAVLVLQSVVPELAGPYLQFVDLQILLCGAGGKERTQAEYNRLFSAAGLRLTEAVATPVGETVLVGAV